MGATSHLHYEYAAGCLKIRATGRFLIEQKEAAIKAIAAAIEFHQAQIALLDVREVAGPYQFIDLYQLGELAGRYLTSVPIGCLALKHQPDPGNIGKVVANNRGARIEVFIDPAAAQAWLKSYSAPNTH